MNNVGEPFYKSISDATISLSKIVVRFINASEICIDYLKHLKSTFIDNEIISIGKEEIDIDGENNDCQFITTVSNVNNVRLEINETSSKSSKESISNAQSDTNVEKNDSSHVSSVIISNLPTDITENELKSLSKDIKRVLLNKNKRNADLW